MIRGRAISSPVAGSSDLFVPSSDFGSSADLFSGIGFFVDVDLGMVIMIGSKSDEPAFFGSTLATACSDGVDEGTTASDGGSGVALGVGDSTGVGIASGIGVG